MNVTASRAASANKGHAHTRVLVCCAGTCTLALSTGLPRWSALHADARRAQTTTAAALAARARRGHSTAHTSPLDKRANSPSLNGGVSDLSADLLSSSAIFAPASRSSCSLARRRLPPGVCSSRSALPGALCDMAGRARCAPRSCRLGWARGQAGPRVQGRRCCGRSNHCSANRGLRARADPLLQLLAFCRPRDAPHDPGLAAPGSPGVPRPRPVPCQCAAAGPHGP